MLGHNNPPSEIEILKQRLDAYEKQKELDKLSAKEFPAVIEDDKTAGAVSDHLSELRSLFSEIGKIHKKEKAPFWDAGKAADAWKNQFEIDIKAIADKDTKILFAWNKKKEDEEKKRRDEIAERERLVAQALVEQAKAHEEEGIHDTANDLLNAAIESENKADFIESSAATVRGKSRGAFSSSSIKKTWTGEVESLAALDLNVLREYISIDELNRAIKRAIKDGGLRKITGARIWEEETLINR